MPSNPFFKVDPLGREHFDPALLLAKLEERPQLTLAPYGDRILVCPDRAQQPKAGIVLLEEEKLARGRVLAVGKGAWRSGGAFEPMPFGAGDWLLYGKFAGSKITLGEEEFILLRMDDVFGVLREEEK